MGRNLVSHVGPMPALGLAARAGLIDPADGGRVAVGSDGVVDVDEGTFSRMLMSGADRPAHPRRGIWADGFPGIMWA